MFTKKSLFAGSRPSGKGWRWQMTSFVNGHQQSTVNSQGGEKAGVNVLKKPNQLQKKKGKKSSQQFDYIHFH